MSKAEAIRTALTAALTADSAEQGRQWFEAELAQHGFAVVPREPTMAMANAAPGRADQGTEESMYHGIWRAMVAAAEAA